jgi:amino acid transporter
MFAGEEAEGIEKPQVMAISARGLRRNALGFVQCTAIGVASTGPAYSIAATLGFAVALAGPETLLLVPLAFVPMFFSAWANKEMNRADPDCGTSFTWAARTLGPRIGWFAGGWSEIVAGLLVMCSQSQIAGQYLFLFLGLSSIGNNPASVWVLLAGIGWIAVLAYLCFRGIEVSARTQVVLLGIELVMLLVLSVWALVRVIDGSAPLGHATPSWSWLDPAHFANPSTFMAGMLLMVFIYWGWDTAVSTNEETKEPDRIPGIASVVSTLLLLATYLLVFLSMESFAGFGSTGIGLNNPGHQGDVLSVIGTSVFGRSMFGVVLTRMLLLMVLSSSISTTQTTILPNARTALSMAFHKALPDIFGKVHPRYLTPSFATIVFATASTIMYIVLNFVSGGKVIADSVTAATFFAVVYLGITGFACVWFYRRTLLQSAQNFWLRGVLPGLSGVMLFGILGWSVHYYSDPGQSYTTWLIPFYPHWRVGGVLSIVILAVVIGLASMVIMNLLRPKYFHGDTLHEGVSITDDHRVLRTSPD